MNTSKVHFQFVRALLGPITFVAVAISVPAHAQNGAAQSGVAVAKSADPTTKRALTIDDYSRWRTINAATISGDGNWVAYGMSFANTPTADSKPVLHILNLDNNTDIPVPDGSNPAFSPDSKWITYFVDPAAPRGGRGGRGGGGGAPPAVAPDSAGGRGRGAAAPPPPRRVELRELATGKIQTWQDIQTATFSPTSSHVLFRRRPASGAAPAGGGRGGAPGGGGGGGRGGAAGGGAVTPPSDVILHDLTNNRGLFLGSVGDAAFTRKGDFFAYVIDATVRDGNGLFVMDLKANTTRALDNDAKNYTRMAFNDDGSAIAVLKGSDVPKMREHDNTLIVFPNLRAAFDAPNATPASFDAAAALPKGFVVSDRAPLTWSDDNKRVFFGMIPQSSAPDTNRRANEDSVADVDVWSYADERVQSLQMARADADRTFTFREVFDVSSSKFVKLGDSTLKEIDVSADGHWAIGRDARGMVSDYERPRADIFRVNTTTGERTLILKGALTGNNVIVGIAPNGKEFLYWKDDKYQSYDLDAGTTKTIGMGAPSFVDLDYDHPGPKPPYGAAGYTKDGTGVIVESRYDLWVLPFDGSAAKNITEGLGTKQEIKFVPVRSETPDPMAPRADREARVYDLTKPITLSAYGEWTKKAGFYQLSSGKLTEVVYDDAAYSTPQKAAKADRFLLTRQTFAEFPDLRVSGPDFKDSKKITDANPQQAEFLWGHRVLFDYKLKDGRRAQGILAIPDDYKQGEKRPMMVTFYEKNSQNMHHYSAPSYVTGMGAVPMEATTKGYLVMLPDVYFHTGSSHSDMLDAVEAGTKKVIEMGYADPKHISLNGHSYGGEGAGFIATRSRLFAAVGVGAGVTDLFSDFAQSWGWSYQNQSGASGQNGLDYYLYGQGRWGFSPWDKPDIYRFESSLTHVPEVTQPILIMHGTADPTVSFQEGLKFYTALRYNKKEAYLLAYLNQPHGLRGLADRRDLTIRYFQFFDHFLKGTPAPKWMTDGVPYLVKDAGGARDPK